MKIIKKIGLLMIIFLVFSCNYCLADLMPIPEGNPLASDYFPQRDRRENTTVPSKGKEKEIDYNFISYIFLGVAAGAVAITIIVLVFMDPKGKIETNNEEKEKLNENKEE